jgi:tetratricopeptide (TPR) repeat protein
MKDEEHLMTVFSAALACGSAADRDAYLDRACAGDPALRGRVEALLRAHDRAGGFLGPAAGPADTAGIRPGAGESPRANDAAPGTVVAGRYKLLEEIGEGGMGTVWMAQQTEPVKRLVAVKLIKPGMGSKQVLARFEAERQALALMDHANIAKVLDGGSTEAGRPFFVMDLVKGVPITRYCDEHQLTPRERLELFAQVCQAVQHAHQKGIIHRDLKPSNVLVAPYDGVAVPKVIDFGIAKAVGQSLTESTLFTGFGAVVGTPEYMSPEQAELNNHDIDTRSDVYALGVLLYELLTGTTPLTRKRLKDAALLEVLRLVREEEPPRPSARLSTTDELPAVAANRGLEPRKLSSVVRGELDWLVMKALEKDRGRRYATANGLAEDVRRYLADEPVLACPPSASYRLRKFARRNRGRLAVCAGVFLAFTVIAATLAWALGDRVARAEEAERAEKVRLATVEGQVRESLNVGRTLIAANKLPAARQKFAEARAQLANDHATLSDLAAEVEASAAGLDRFQQFLDRIDQAHQAETAPFLTAALMANADRGDRGLPPVAPGRRPAAAVPLLLEALALYAVLQRLDWNATLEDERLGKSQIDHIRRTAYEELLWLANDILRRQEEHPSGRHVSAAEAGRAALVYLARAEKAHRPTRAFYALRADCRKALGEEEASRADQQLAQTIAPTIALDHFLQGQAAYDAKQPTRAIEAFDAALTLEPTHYWSMMYLGFCLNGVARTPAEYAGAARVFTACMMKRPDHHYPYMCRAMIYANQGRYQEALADNSRAIELQPNDPRAWYNRGNRYWELRQPDQAIADYTRAIDLDPTLAQAWNNRGILHLDKGEAEKAVADLTRAVKLDATLVFAWHNRGTAHGKLGRLDLAIADYSQAVKVAPTFAPSWTERGQVYETLGQHDQAVADFNQVLKLDGNDATTCFYRGLAYAALGQHENAVVELSRAAELNPKHGTAWFQRGLANYKLRRFQDAVNDFTQVIDLDPSNAQAWYNRGNAYADMGQPEQAVADCTQAIKLDPNDAKAWVNRGVAYMALREFDKAIDDYSQAIKLDEKLAVAWHNRGNVYRILNQLDKALHDYSQAVKWDKKLAISWYSRATIYARLNQYDQAIADYTQAIKWDDKLASAWNDRGAMYQAKKQFNEALADYSRAIQLDEKKAIAWYNRGVIYEEQGQYEKAIADLSRFLELAPVHPKRAEAYLRRALCNEDTGHYEDALKDYREFEKAVPLKAVLQNRIARLLANCPEVKLRDPKLAVERARKAVEMAPKDGRYWTTLGMAYYRAGDWNSAVAALDKAVELRLGGDAADWLFLAMAHQKLGKGDEARQAYHRAMRWLETNKALLDRNKTLREDLCRFLSEAEDVLEIEKK